MDFGGGIVRVALLISYRGTRYAGWQRQPNRPTVQAAIEDALFEATGKTTVIHASGRTDAGVHAYGQVAHFDTESAIPAENFAVMLNRLLPPDIRIRASAAVGGSFHARKCAVTKTYVYRVLITPIENALEWDTAYSFRFPVMIEPMQKAARLLTGQHDFASFYSQGSTAATTERTLTELSVDIAEGKVSSDGFLHVGEIRIRATADGFLYNMVRVLAAQLIEVGQGRKSPDDLQRIMSLKNRALAKECAPPQGLYLVGVDYGLQIFS